MKKLKVYIIAAFSLAAIAVIAQAVTGDVNSSVGNGKAMEYNLNEPNAINPAQNNIYNYEKDGVVLDKSNHPDKNLSNHYNSSSYQEKK